MPVRRSLSPKRFTQPSNTDRDPDTYSTVLERLTITDYRSCIDTTIDLQPDLSVLIGPNGSGKTNILSALLLLRTLGTERDVHYRQADDSSTECRLKASLRCDDKACVLTAKIKLRTDENNTDVIVGSKQSWYAKEFTRSAQRIRVPLWLMSSDLFENRYRFHVPGERTPLDDIPESFRRALQKIGLFLRNIKYYSASQFTNPSMCPVSFEVEQEGSRHTGVRLRGHSRFLFDLYKAREKPSYEQFINVIGPDGIGLVDDVQFNEVLTSSVEYTVRSGGEVQQRKREKILVVPQFVIGRNTLSPSQLSEGTFKTITLLFYLMTQKSSALLIEEPEVCVHHGLLSSIVELINTYSKQKQIIVSTHSDFVLDQIDPRNVYRVTRSPECGTQVSQIEKDMPSAELKALKKYLETQGNLGEYWRDGGLD
jgi:ABC-type lipoprotein export system ATPase subunit